MDNLVWLDTHEYPFRHNFFRTPFGSLHYVDEGEGEPVVFIHGNPSWSFQFRNVIKGLSGTHRCIAPDLLGFGLSDKPPEWSYLPEDHARNLELFLESLDLHNITLVVGDWGGPVGLSYAVHHPEKVRNIVITNTWLWSVRGDLYFQVFSKCMGGPVGRWLIHRYNFFATTLMPSMFGTKSLLTPAIHRHYIAPLARPEERKGCWVFPGQITRSSEWLQTLWELRGVLQDKHMLIAWGMKDIAFRKKELATWMRAFPGARVVRYEDAGHFVSEEKPTGLVTEIQDLLESRSYGEYGVQSRK
jgi:pimeloyl-ACP methyl ester carboxylesterase